LVVKLGLLRHLLRQQPAVDDTVGGATPPQGRLGVVLTELQAESADILEQLRQVSAALYPPLLYQAGLGPALREAFIQAGVTAEVHATDVRFDVAAEGAAYFAVMACLALEPRPDLRAVTVSYDAAPPARAMVLDLVGVGGRHAEALVEQVCRVGGTVQMSTQAQTPRSTARIPCG
jgi:hypothetical protein